MVRRRRCSVERRRDDVGKASDDASLLFHESRHLHFGVLCLYREALRLFNVELERLRVLEEEAPRVHLRRGQRPAKTPLRSCSSESTNVDLARVREEPISATLDATRCLSQCAAFTFDDILIRWLTAGTGTQRCR